jgi:mono/diheme cytochrome c family protein
MEHNMKRLILSLTLLTAIQLHADVKAGQQVYKANCAICHTVNGGSALGPDFNLVAYKRHKEEIEAYAKNPYDLAEKFGYSANAMPTLPLEDQEFKDVADYISSLQPFKEWMKKDNSKPKKKIIVKNSENNTTNKEEKLVENLENNETKREG